MSTIVTHKGILVKINTERKIVEHSKNNGISWVQKSIFKNYGDLISLIDLGNELLLETTKGTYHSRNEGISWVLKKSK